jgi:hypothetical protein
VSLPLVTRTNIDLPRDSLKVNDKGGALGGGRSATITQSPASQRQYTCAFQARPHRVTTMTEHLTTIGTYFWLHEALVASSLLEGAGIPAYLHDTNLIRLNWMYVNAIQGIRLQVPIARANEARAVLHSDGVMFEDMPSPDPCTNCGGESCQLVRPGRRVTFFTWLVVGVPVWRQPPFWKCSGCGLALH